MKDPEVGLPKQVLGWVRFVNGYEGLDRPRRFPNQWHVVYELFSIELVRLLLGVQTTPWLSPQVVRFDSATNSYRIAYLDQMSDSFRERHAPSWFTWWICIWDIWSPPLPVVVQRKEESHDAALQAA